MTPLAAAVVPEVKQIRAVPHSGCCSRRGAPRCLAISWLVGDTSACCGISLRLAWCSAWPAMIGMIRMSGLAVRVESAIDSSPGSNSRTVGVVSCTACWTSRSDQRVLSGQQMQPAARIDNITSNVASVFVPARWTGSIDAAAPQATVRLLMLRRQASVQAATTASYLPATATTLPTDAMALMPRASDATREHTLAFETRLLLPMNAGSGEQAHESSTDAL